MSNTHEAKRTNQPGVHKSKKILFVERRPEGDYAVRKANSERASAVLPTQAEAIERARQLSKGVAPLVERVRHTTGGKPDKWRKEAVKSQPISSRRISTEEFKSVVRDKTVEVINEGRASKTLSATFKKLTAADLFLATEFERIKLIREGVPANFLVRMGRTMDISKELLFSTLALPRSTIVRKIQKKELLSTEQSERVIGLERLVGQVQEMVKQSSNAEEFNAGIWVGEWLQQPLPALGGKRPAEYMDTMEGQSLISRLLSQSQSGAYA